MPFVTHRGQRIHYEVKGQGPTVVLQHGLLSRGSHWAVIGYVAGLVDRYRVVVVDSLGHGDSDKPGDAGLYAREQRAGDLIAVCDAVGAERVHLVGYSMGAWIATGVAIHDPGRLLSLTLGGWDPIDGRKLALPEELRDNPPGVEVLIGHARTAAPKLVEWITPEVMPAMSACWNALAELDGVGEALLALACPVLLWCGAKDPYFHAVKALAQAQGLAFLATDGDHIGAMMLEAPTVLERLRAFFDEVDAKPI